MRFPRLQERFGDRLLTVLTILFALLLFVIAPLHAAGIVLSQDVGLAVAFVVIVTVLFAYGISVAVVMMLLGFGVALAATVLRPDSGFGGVLHNLLTERNAVSLISLRSLPLFVGCAVEDAVRGVDAPDVKVTILEAALPLVEHIDCFRFVRFHRGHCFFKHRLGFLQSRIGLPRLRQPVLRRMALPRTWKGEAKS